MMPRMGRPPLYPDKTLCRLPAGTLAAIRALCRDGEMPADVIREAVARELRRRARLSSKSSIKVGATAAPSSARQAGKR